ncbi:beta-glucosidase [Ranunculus cassubicifolius]
MDHLICLNFSGNIYTCFKSGKNAFSLLTHNRQWKGILILLLLYVLQTEGIAAGGRGPATWDVLFQGGDIATDSYHMYKDDIAMMKQMEMNSYRFSICWSRFLPKGTIEGGINQEGVDFYNNLIDEMMAKGIEPFVTLFHFDLPSALQDAYGGLGSRQFVDDYAAYAEFCFKTFGDRVKHWATFNEPHVFAAYGSTMGSKKPVAGTTRPYIATHHTILAHATANKIYKEKYFATQGGEIGISLMTQWMLPYNDDHFHKDAKQRGLDFMVGWYLGPLVTGHYPFIMKAIVRDRLPDFTEEERNMVKGSLDFIAVNYYTTRFAEGVPINPNDKPTGFDKDHYVNYSITHPETQENVNIYSVGLKDLLIHIKNHYLNPKIYITENGKNLCDGLEPNQGYTLRMGLIYTDYANGMKRIPKASAKWFKGFMRAKKTPVIFFRRSNLCSIS